MSFIISKIRHIDPFIFFSVIGISIIGLLSIKSSSPELFTRQLVFVVFGFFVMYLISFVDWRVFRDNPLFILVFYLGSVLLLLGLFEFGEEARGVYRWYSVGPVFIDPAEITKLVLIILFAKYFSTRHAEMYRVSHILLSVFYVLIPALLIFRQPDLGSALIIVIMWFGMLLLSGIKLKHFALLCLAGVLIISSGWMFFMEDYQRDRVLSFVEPDLDPRGIGWGQNQARIAVGNGGLLGEGLGSGSQTQYGFLPESHTDYIFAAIAEEMGFLGVLVLLSLFLVLLWRCIVIVLSSKTNFPRLLVSGFAIIIFVQVFINVGMNLGIMPIVGTPLPLVSYGGSSLLFVFAGLGLVHSIRFDKNK